MLEVQGMDEGGGEGGGVLPEYAMSILVAGCISIFVSLIVLVGIANVTPFGGSQSGLAYMLALLASFNLMVMHSIVHGLSPAGA